MSIHRRQNATKVDSDFVRVRPMVSMKRVAASILLGALVVYSAVTGTLALWPTIMDPAETVRIRMQCVSVELLLLALVVGSAWLIRWWVRPR